jgi:hypothetical protein
MSFDTHPQNEHTSDQNRDARPQIPDWLAADTSPFAGGDAAHDRGGDQDRIPKRPSKRRSKAAERIRPHP